jgi:hypothetical protein
VRAAVYLTLTPFLLLVGWSSLVGGVVEASGLADGTSGKVFISASSLLMIPLGVAFGWRYRHRSLQLPARLLLTPIVLFSGCMFLAGLLILATGPESRIYGTLGTIVALALLPTVPLGIALGWRYRHRSLRLPAHLILTPIVFYLGWCLLWALLAWLTGQAWMVTGVGGMTAYIVALLMIPLGIALGWRRYRHRLPHGAQMPEAATRS